MATVLVAPGAFKGTLTPGEAADAMCAGVTDALPRARIIRCPIADGGDGTCEVLSEHLGGELTSVSVTGPDGSQLQADLGILPTELVVVEMASASGLRLTSSQDHDPLGATSRGTGELISAALDFEPRRIVVGVGGSASSDGGAGALAALGVGFFDDRERSIAPGARGLVELASVDTTFRDKRLRAVELIVACDVRNPLLGPDGAARVFAPQKGATPEMVETMEKGLERLSEVLMSDAGRWIGEDPMGGAGGGIAAGLAALAGGELRPGFDVVAEMLGFKARLQAADLLIVGEGSLDSQSLSGKATLAAAAMAKIEGIPVLAVAGRVVLSRDQLLAAGVLAAAGLGPPGSLSAAEALRSATASLVAGRGL